MPNAGFIVELPQRITSDPVDGLAMYRSWSSDIIEQGVDVAGDDEVASAIVLAVTSVLPLSCRPLSLASMPDAKRQMKRDAKRSKAEGGVSVRSTPQKNSRPFCLMKSLFVLLGSGGGQAGAGSEKMCHRRKRHRRNCHRRFTSTPLRAPSRESWRASPPPLLPRRPGGRPTCRARRQSAASRAPRGGSRDWSRARRRARRVGNGRG